MSDGLYEILALAARYFFAALFLLIVLRAARITLRDGRRAKKLRRWAPETGLSGELMVVEGDERAKRGMRYPVIREGVLGSGRAFDIEAVDGAGGNAERCADVGEFVRRQGVASGDRH